MDKIEKDRKYFLQEIVDLKLIEGIDRYAIIYNLVTHFEKGLKGEERILNELTTKLKIKADDSGHPWNKIAGKIFVEGKELIKFKTLNKIK
ncbi:MAG: hypothetical protein KAT66_00365 [Candidatus Lokiarchaeota archaeon]|nr:hypothetical protein [Candidatus Lokiarchaeota archaeon]